MKEIEIPEGYEARIEGNKVILEQKKSDDEKLLEAMIFRFGDLSEIWFENIFCKQFTKAQILSYLEKLKEQKPVKWNDADDKIQRNLMSLLSCMRGDRIAEATYKKYYPWLRDLPKRFNLQQPAGWSEGDEGMLNCIIATLCEESHGGREANDKMVTWLENRLKSLRPQPSGNLAISFINYLDEHRPDGKICLSNGECANIETAFKREDWAMVIRYVNKYQPHWKPSEEQMEALETGTENTQHLAATHFLLESLYNDLKKLM